MYLQTLDTPLTRRNISEHPDQIITLLDADEDNNTFAVKEQTQKETIQKNNVGAIKTAGK